MNFITAITLAITIAWLQCNALASALVNTRRGRVQSDATHLDAASAGRPSTGERQLRFENEIDGSYVNLAKAIRLDLGPKIDPMRVVLPNTPHRESTTTARPSKGQIPRPAIVSRQDRWGLDLNHQETSVELQ